MGTKNKIGDLRNHMFAMLEKLNDDALTGDALKAELERANAMAQLAGVIVNSAKVEVQFMKMNGGGSVGFFPDAVGRAAPRLEHRGESRDDG